MLVLTLGVQTLNERLIGAPSIYGMPSHTNRARNKMKIKKLHLLRSYAHHSNSLASASYSFSCTFSNHADIFDIVKINKYNKF